MTIIIERADLSAPIFEAVSATELTIRAGTILHIDGRKRAFAEADLVSLGDLVPGADYQIDLDQDGNLLATPCEGIPTGALGGFHFAPAGNAPARAGGVAGPAINPYSIWDAGFRPASPDPRAMALVANGIGMRFWVDLYLLGIDHLAVGTSRCGATIADGVTRPPGPDGNRVDRLDYPTTVAIFAHHGKGLLGAEEFFTAAYGVQERQSRSDEPTTTGTLDDNAIRFVSKWGVFDATGTMWQWGTDGDPDNPRASFFGGSWIGGEGAGSRSASLVSWPGASGGDLGARGRSDHLNPAA